MNLFRRHLLARHFRYVALALAALTCVIMIFGYLSAPDLGAARPAGRSGGFLEFARSLLSAINTALPLAVLTGTLFAVGESARYQEVAALRAAGWSTMQVVRPLLVVAVGASLLSAILHKLEPPVVKNAIQASAAIEPPSSPAETAEKRTEWHAHNSYPLLNLVAFMVAIPFAVSSRRSTVYASFGTALGLVVVYYVVTAVVHALGRHGKLDPVVAGWICPVLFFGGARVLWVKANL